MSAVQSGGKPAIPIAAERVWDFFWTLDQRRQSNGYSANAISHQEIEACARLYRVRLEPWELRALVAMERDRLAWLNTDPKDRRTVADEPLTVDRFRSLFGVKTKGNA